MATILIIDDLATEVQVMQSTVTKLGHRSLVANDGETGQNMAISEKPDLILLDVVLPKQDGFNTCRNLKKNEATKDIPVIPVTSKNRESDKFWGLRQGAVAYLVKPFNPDDLKSLVEEHLPVPA